MRKMSLRLDARGVFGAMVVMLGVAGCAYGISFDSNLDEDESFVGQGGALQATSSVTTSATTSVPTTTSSSTTTSSTTTSSSTTTGSSSSCDLQGDCFSCANCSIGGQCAKQFSDCTSNSDCTSFLNCLSSCQDETCANNCSAQYATGFKLYMIMTACAFCDACPVDCQADSQGLCN